MSWNDMAPWWNARMGERGDWFNRELIKPYMLQSVSVEAAEREITVIDVGCGNGFMCREFAGLGAKVVGIDASEQMIASARQYQTDGIEYRVADATVALPFGETFDFIIINNVLQDVENMSALLANVRAVCHGKTQVLITVRHPCFHPKKQDLGWRLRKGDGEAFFSGQGLTAILDSGEPVDGVFFATDEYFGDIQNARAWDNGSTQSYNRTITSYVREFIGNGFRILDVFEPTPKTLDNSVAELAARIPVFIMFKLGI